MNVVTRRDIATRLRTLLAVGQEELADTARRLGVEELALRMSVDEMSPFPTLDVLVAVVAHYGVDPSYLLTGVYDAATHRQVADADVQAVATAVSDYVRRESAPVVRRTPEKGSRIV
jgi:hypothetical protein